MWMPARKLVSTGTDAFQIEEFAKFKVRFQRDAHGCVISMSTEGLPFEGVLTKSATPPPLKTFLDSPGADSFASLARAAGDDPARLLKLGERMLNVLKFRAAAGILAEQLVRIAPKDAASWQLRGDAAVAQGATAEAIQYFRKSLSFDQKNEDTRRKLEMLGDRKPASDLPKLPFALEDVFRSPSSDEIQAVRNHWASLDLSPRGVKELQASDLTIRGTRFRLHVIEHQVLSGREIGVILVPTRATARSLPVLVEAKGVSPTFFPLKVPDGLNVVDIMGDDIGRFIIVAPGFRGEEVHVGDQVFRSDSPHESWSGAADDLLAFLNVALATTPEADASRICVFGRSRGGGVALLAGERDHRIRCVAEWAGPTDWFSLMGEDGWTPRQVAEDALRYHARLSDRGGQFIYNFLRHAVAGEEDLAAVRSRLIASSPLYFAAQLPATQIHYGMEDSMVPIRNGRSLAREADAHKVKLEVHFYPDAGHDQDIFQAPQLTKRFLLDGLLGKAPGK